MELDTEALGALAAFAAIPTKDGRNPYQEIVAVLSRLSPDQAAFDLVLLEAQLPMRDGPLIVS